MRLRLGALAFSIVLILGCAGPASGTYDLLVSTTDSDCVHDFAEFSPAGPMSITVDPFGNTMTIAGPPDEVCDLDEDQQFTCAMSAFDTQETYTPELYATVTVDLTMTGVWNGSDRFDGVANATLSCAGEDCASLTNSRSGDCAIAWSYTALLD